jgi:hypothetical protein
MTRIVHSACTLPALMLRISSGPDMNLNHLHTELILLSGGYIEVCCYDMELTALRRHWSIRRTVDYRYITWC